MRPLNGIGEQITLLRHGVLKRIQRHPEQLTPDGTVGPLTDVFSLGGLLREMLSLDGFCVLAAENGRAGLELAAREHPDLILCDIMMPEIGPTELYAEMVRLNPALADRIIFMTGGTFTISNGGVFGSLLSTPILNPPQTAILGMHKIQERPMAVNGQVVILPMMYLALSYDHRLIDGKEAVSFLVAIKDLVEDPARLLLEI